MSGESKIEEGNEIKEQAVELRKIKPPEKALLEQINPDEFKEFLKLFSVSLDAFGEFVLKMGNIEKKTGLNFYDSSRMMQNPEYLDKMINSLPPDIIGLFLKILYRASLINNIKLEKLDANEKIKVGKEMKFLAENLNELFDKIDAYFKRGGKE